MYNLIIPCAGTGKRFIEAGYKEYKPLIPVFGKPMVHHVLDAFPPETRIFIITGSEHKSVLPEVLYKGKQPEIIYIKSHKQGPSWSLCQAKDYLPLDEPAFVAYNDIIWSWDFRQVEDFINKFKPDGIVFTQTGYHPHLYKNNFSAFCKVAGNDLCAIKEKGSFTSDWLNEHLSTGVFYFSSIGDMIENANKLIDGNQRIAGEFYPSEIFNLMVAQHKQIKTFETSKFLHAGIPQQKEDAENWHQILKIKNKPTDIPALVMMCGTGMRMKTVSSLNKAGLAINGEPMFRFIAEKNGSSHNIFLVNDSTESLLLGNDQYINIGGQTRSQAESLLKASDRLMDFKSLLVLSNDCYGIFDSSLLSGFRNCELVLFGFQPSLMQQKQHGAHTGFSFRQNMVTEVHIKSIENDDLGLAGMYYFPETSIIKEISSYDYLNNGSIDHFAKSLLNRKGKVGFIKLDHYIHLGTPEEYFEYNYWNNFFNE